MLTKSPEEIWGTDYADWWDEVTSDGEAEGSAMHERYLEELAIQPGHVVLDLGVGTGRLLPPLLGSGAHVVGLDLSYTMMSRAQERFGRRVELVNADAQCLPFASGSFDRVVAWFMWENIPDQQRTIAEVARVLRPGGQLLFSTKNFMHFWSMRLAWYRVKRGQIRRAWRFISGWPRLAALLPGRLRSKCQRIIDLDEVPQYPTLLSGLRRTASRAGLELALLHKFSHAGLEDAGQLPGSARYFWKFIAVFRKRAA